MPGAGQTKNLLQQQVERGRRDEATEDHDRHRVFDLVPRRVACDDQGHERQAGTASAAPLYAAGGALLKLSPALYRLIYGSYVRRTYGLPTAVIPPFWHHHPELLWELSALHLHWLCAYDPEQNGSAPLGWHRDFADARARLRDWVAACGTRLDRDRPTRQTNWPGEDPTQPIEDSPITDRDEDFVRFVIDMVDARQEAEDAFFAGIDPETGEV